MLLEEQEDHQGLTMTLSHAQPCSPVRCSAVRRSSGRSPCQVKEQKATTIQAVEGVSWCLRPGGPGSRMFQGTKPGETDMSPPSEARLDCPIAYRFEQ